MWSYLGFTNYYHRFICHYAQIASSLNTLILEENASKKNKFVDWTSECDQAFKQLKDLYSKSPILSYADYSKPFKLHMDVCGTRLWVVLYQSKHDGLDRVRGYTSKILCKANRRYPTYKPKFLAFK